MSKIYIVQSNTTDTTIFCFSPTEADEQVKKLNETNGKTTVSGHVWYWRQVVINTN